VSPFNQVASRTLARLLLGFGQVATGLWPGCYWALGRLLLGFGQVATGLSPGGYWALFTRWCCGRGGDKAYRCQSGLQDSRWVT
jgi:hypothetical protein